MSERNPASSMLKVKSDGTGATVSTPAFRSHSSPSSRGEPPVVTATKS